MIGERLDRYQVVEMIGNGGMGLVYRAEDRVLRRDVALKVLSPGALTDSNMRERFKNEARALSRLNHPNIATVFDFRSQEGSDFLVMELVEGPTLSQLLKNGPLPVGQAVRYTRQILEALKEAHASGIVHRDLKPGNVILNPRGEVKVLDFGLAKLIDEAAATAAPLTTEGVVAGTIPYMSPEQVRGEPANPSFDLYAVGALLYEMLTGCRPFPETQTAPLLNAILHSEPRPISQLNASIPPGLARIASRALEKDPKRRFQSATEMLSSLIELDEQPTVVEPLDGLSVRRWVLPRSWPVTLLAVALLAVGIVGILALTWNWLGRDGFTTPFLTKVNSKPVLAILPLSTAGADQSLEPLGVGIAHSLTTSLAAIPSVTMISASDTRSLDPARTSVPEMAEELGADFVVNGSIQGVGDQIQLSVNLVSRDGSVVWGGQVSGAGRDLFSLQAELAGALSGALRLMLSPADQARLSTPPTANVEAYAEFTQARAFLERPDIPGNLDRAIQLFQSALDKDSNFAMAYAGLGEGYWELYKKTNDRQWTEKALEATVDALRLDSDEPSVRYSLALIYQGTGRTSDALKELDQTLALQPNNDDARRLMGEILSDSGQAAKAIEEFKRAIAVRPNYWRNFRALGLAYYRTGDLQGAQKAFQRVTELQPDLPWGFQMLGLVLHSQDELEEASRNYKRAIELGPSPASYSNLGTIHYRQGRYQDAAESYTEALKLKPNSPTTHGNLGDALGRLGQRTQATEAYSSAVELLQGMLEVNPNDPDSLGMLALYEAKLGLFDEALKHSEEAVSLAPKNADVLYNQSVVRVLSDKPGEAIASLRLALNNGYPVAEVAHDEDLARLRGVREFDELLPGTPRRR